MNWKNNIPLIVGLALPVLMILFVAGSIYLPRMGSGVPPAHDFLYITQENGPGADGYVYTVKQGKLTRQEDPYRTRPIPEVGSDGKAVLVKPAPLVDTARLYIHDVRENKSREISFEEAMKLSLDLAVVSPDGFELRQGSGNRGIFNEIFGGGRNDYNTWYLIGKGKAVELNLENRRGEYNYGYVQFMGWITK